MAKAETIKAENIISVEDARRVITLDRQEQLQQLQISLAQWQQDHRAEFTIVATRGNVTVPIEWLLPQGWGIAVIAQPRGE